MRHTANAVNMNNQDCQEDLGADGVILKNLKNGEGKAWI